MLLFNSIKLGRSSEFFGLSEKNSRMKKLESSESKTKLRKKLEALAKFGKRTIKIDQNRGKENCPICKFVTPKDGTVFCNSKSYSSEKCRKFEFLA